MSEAAEPDPHDELRAFLREQVRLAPCADVARPTRPPGPRRHPPNAGSLRCSPRLPHVTRRSRGVRLRRHTRSSGTG